jgi:hypothetical protein
MGVGLYSIFIDTSRKFLRAITNSIYLGDNAEVFSYITSYGL